MRDRNSEFALSFCFCASVIFLDRVPSLKPQIRKDVTSTCSLFLSVQNISHLLNRCYPEIFFVQQSEVHLHSIAVKR